MTSTETRATATVACPFCQTLNRVDMARVADRPKCGNCGKPILLDRPIAITDQVFDKVTRDTTVPVVVDFYADWCGPCKIMAPLLDDAAHKRAGQMLFAKLDTDRNPLTGQRFVIRGIPTLIAFRNGKEVGRRVGAIPPADLEAFLNGI
ncbi:MAG TPA: thioredoxin TrxC [Gemmatimonadales bacterium]|nr:thioredoxin TrxC [Gemmatimonadales bacterium]